MPPPFRLLLDTNVFILGYLDLESVEGQILHVLTHHQDITLILSDELTEQIQRVARRTQNKDWAGYLIDRIWRDYTVEYVLVADEDRRELEAMAVAPREDIGIYLTALRGRADYFVSANHELVQQAATKQRLFTCLTPTQFLKLLV